MSKKEIQRDGDMPLSLRIPADKERKLEKYANKTGMSKTAVILSAVDEKLGLSKNREQVIRELAGWLAHEEAEELRGSVEVFNQINEGDWD